MDVSDEERKDAEKAGSLVRKKLFQIMDLQADIDPNQDTKISHI